MDDNGTIPEDLRCKRSDGKQWRCSALSMPDKTVCEKHYIQAKKRAANSAMRASLKKAKRKSMDHSGVNYMDDRNDDLEMSVSPLNNAVGGGECSIPNPTKKHKGKTRRKGHDFYSPDTAVGKGGSSVHLRSRDDHFEEDQVMTLPRFKSIKNFDGTHGSSTGDCFGRATYSSDEDEGLTCHQCRRNDRDTVLWCMNCNKIGYCDRCIERWYADISMDDIQRACPSCRGICRCVVCRPGDALIKTRIQQVPSIKRLQYLHSLLSFTLPVLKKIHSEQCAELDIENKVNGIKGDILRAKINIDEQMCCDICTIPIVDYHRHCANCLTDICVQCVRDLRVGLAKDIGEYQTTASTQGVSPVTNNLKSSGGQVDGQCRTGSEDTCTLDFSHLYPKWKSNKDGSVPCPNECHSFLVLRRICKINWVAKLVKNVVEMVNGCRVSEWPSSENCISCSMTEITQSSGFNESNIYKYSHREDSGDNILYNPISQDITHETIAHFRNHWVKGEPVIVRQVIDATSASTWEPKSICRGIQEAIYGRTKEDSMIAKVIDCSTHSEVNIEFEEFIRGYSEGRVRGDNTPEILKLKDWPNSDDLENFLLCQRPELFTKLPLLEYIHSRWGLLNLAAKLPHETLQTDSGPRLHIAYGTTEELGSGDSVWNLKISMGDTVHLLMHTTEVKFQNKDNIMNDGALKTYEEYDLKEKQRDTDVLDFNGDAIKGVDSPDSPPKEHCEKTEQFSMMNIDEVDILDDRISIKAGINIAAHEMDVSLQDKNFLDVQEKDYAGVVWDVFRRQDIPILNEYIRRHAEELSVFDNSSSTNQIKHPLYDQTYFLNTYHKRNLKEELGIEPWTFKQLLGEAVFIPAGCAFQTRNLKSAVQLTLDYLSPESLSESIHLAKEIRCLPNTHVAKLQMLEVAKMPLYAASWAIQEIQKITLDPKVGSELGFEDRNLTAKVSENLQRLIKRNRTACA